MFSKAVTCGIIPTRVGTRSIKSDFTETRKDHPHACGDKSIIIVKIIICQGSSPRVWGQVNFRRKRMLYTRIIPTRVGTSCLPLLRIDSQRDHPHACGDKFLSYPALLYSSGSSPRVWGQVAICSIQMTI